MLKRRYINILFTLLAVSGVLVGMEQPEKRTKNRRRKAKKIHSFLAGYGTI